MGKSNKDLKIGIFLLVAGLSVIAVDAFALTGVNESIRIIIAGIDTFIWIPGIVKLGDAMKAQEQK